MQRLGASSSRFLAGGAVACASPITSQLRTKYHKLPDANWDPEHEDINEHVKKRIPGETRADRIRRFAREWRNVELELGVYKDSRGREIKYRKTFVFRYTYPNAFDESWTPSR